jgi:hypothetical protein
MKTRITVAGLIFAANCGFAQTSMLQDKGGETSLFIANKAVFINAADASATISINFRKPQWFIGGSFKLGATDGVANIFDGEKINRELSVKVSAGKTLPSSSLSTSRFIYILADLQNSKYNLLKTDNSNTFDKNTFKGFSMAFGYNELSSIGTSPIIFGASAKFGKVNNLEQLTPVKTFITNTVPNGSAEVTAERSGKNGYSGDFLSFTSFRLNFDAYAYPKTLGGRLGLGGYVRSQLSGAQKKNNLGIGAIVGEQGAPANVVFGLLYQFDDVFNQLDSDSNVFKRGGINIVAGYSF